MVGMGTQQLAPNERVQNETRVKEVACCKQHSLKEFLQNKIFLQLAHHYEVQYSIRVAYEAFILYLHHLIV